MANSAQPTALHRQPTVVLAQACTAISAAEPVLQAAKAAVQSKVAGSGSLDDCQHAAHGLSWLATYVEAMRQLGGWANRLTQEDAFGELEQLLLTFGLAEYAAQIAGGIPMSQGEFARLKDIGLEAADVRRFEDSIVASPSSFRRSRPGKSSAMRGSTKLTPPYRSRCAGSAKPKWRRMRTTGI